MHMCPIGPRRSVIHITGNTDHFTSRCIMAWKNTQLCRIVIFTCPNCHEGRFFKRHPYDLPLFHALSTE